MRLVATLTTGYTIQLACAADWLDTPLHELATLMDAEMPWVETAAGAVIRRETIIALHLDDGSDP